MTKVYDAKHGIGIRVSLVVTVPNQWDTNQVRARQRRIALDFVIITVGLKTIGIQDEESTRKESWGGVPSPSTTAVP